MATEDKREEFTRLLAQLYETGFTPDHPGLMRCVFGGGDNPDQQPPAAHGMGSRPLHPGPTRPPRGATAVPEEPQGSTDTTPTRRIPAGAGKR